MVPNMEDDTEQVQALLHQFEDVDNVAAQKIVSEGKCVEVENSPSASNHTREGSHHDGVDRKRQRADGVIADWQYDDDDDDDASRDFLFEANELNRKKKSNSPPKHLLLDDDSMKTLSCFYMNYHCQSNELRTGQAKAAYQCILQARMVFQNSSFLELIILSSKSFLLRRIFMYANITGVDSQNN